MLRIIVAVALVGALAACTAVPVATTYQANVQQKMQSVEHWQVLADEVGAAVVGQAAGQPVYVTPNMSSSFAVGFGDYLRTQIMVQGAALASDPRGALIVSYGLEKVVHGGLRPSPILDGSVFALPAAIIVQTFTGDLAFASRSEVIVTVETTSQGRVTFRETRGFYIPYGDGGNYQSAPLVSAAQLPPPPPPPSVRVGDLLIPPGGCIASQCQIVHSY
jgi:hypothetical protein